MLQRKPSQATGLENFLTFFQRRKPPKHRVPVARYPLVEEFNFLKHVPPTPATGIDFPLPANTFDCIHDPDETWVYCPNGSDDQTFLYYKCMGCGYRHNPWATTHPRYDQASRAIGQQRVLDYEGRDRPGRAELDPSALQGWADDNE